MATWEHFAHGADIGVRGTGASVGEAFEQAALAMLTLVAVVHAREHALVMVDGEHGTLGKGVEVAVRDQRCDLDDDVRLGSVPAQWSTEPFDDKARHDEDLKYAGHMEPHGQFVPSFAGPNPARRNLNNVGNLSVIAKVADGGQQLNATGQLIVTVQRWNTPSLR